MNHTIYDIAKAANVSKSTVSRVLNNHSNISEDARKRVLKAIEELNYQPNKIARGLSGGFDAILVISRPRNTTENNPFFSEILQVISRYTEEQGYDVILQSSQTSEEELEKCISKIGAKMIKGIIMLSSPSEEDIVKELDKFGIPVVVIGKVVGDYKHIYSVDTNNYQDSYDLIEHFISLGHEDIACLYSPLDYQVSVDRLGGYISAMKSNHLPLRDEYMINSGFTMEDGYETAKKLFVQQNNYPSAIFATDDLKLLSLYKVLDEISPPKQIQVGGYINSEISSFLFPAIIQIMIPTNELGKVATELLFSIIKDKKMVEDRTIIIPTRKIIQNTMKNREEKNNQPNMK